MAYLNRKEGMVRERKNYIERGVKKVSFKRIIIRKIAYLNRKEGKDELYKEKSKKNWTLNQNLTR